ncbi:MAG: YfiR family protein [Bacteroidetes bacterium]|nr:YfiR family protein [Bacteroidota bacterium]
MKFLARTISLILLFVLTQRSAGVRYQEINYKSYSLLLHSFAKNIDWPDEMQRSTFVFGIYGKSKLYDELQLLTRTKKVRHMTIEVRTINTPAEAANCQLVFVPSSRSSAVAEINKEITGKPVLLVCERANYYQRGAAISYSIDEQGALRFDINTQICAQHKLVIRPQLLQIADRVY